MTTPLRPASIVADELTAAQSMAEASSTISRSDPLVAFMLRANDEEVAELRNELRESRSSDVEVSIEGRPVTEHRIGASFLARLINDMQAAYRATAEMVAGATVKPTRAATALTVAATAPGSFRVMFRTAEEQISLLEPPLSGRTLESLFDVISRTEHGDGPESLGAWAAQASEAGQRSLIRLAATLASSQGVAQFRWTPPGADTRVLALSSEAARSLAAGLAGAMGREVLNISGHLSMAQDEPPRIRITTEVDEFLLAVRDEQLLDVVRELLFQDVEAEVVIDMTTSPTTGAPLTRSELLDLRLAQPKTP